MLEDLAKVQASPAELQQYVSLTSLQNKGLKRHFRELEAPTEKLKRKADNEEESESIKSTVNSIKMSKRKRLVILDNIKQDETKLDPNVVGFEVSLKQQQMYGNYKVTTNQVIFISSSVAVAMKITVTIKRKINHIFLIILLLLMLW